MNVMMGRVRVTDFELEFVEDEKSFEEGWLHCYAEILDEDGGVRDEYSVKSAVEFHEEGGSLFDSRFNEGLDDKKVSGDIEAAMEEYLDHPDVKEQLAETYEEGLRLTEEEAEDNEDDDEALAALPPEESDVDDAIELLEDRSCKILYSDCEEIRIRQHGDEKTILKTNDGWIVTWLTRGGHDWQGECPKSFQDDTGLRWATCRDPERLPKFGVQTYRSASGAARAV